MSVPLNYVARLFASARFTLFALLVGAALAFVGGLSDHDVFSGSAFAGWCSFLGFIVLAIAFISAATKRELKDLPIIVLVSVGMSASASPDRFSGLGLRWLYLVLAVGVAAWWFHLEYVEEDVELDAYYSPSNKRFAWALRFSAFAATIAALVLKPTVYHSWWPVIGAVIADVGIVLAYLFLVPVEKQQRSSHDRDYDCLSAPPPPLP